MRSTICLVLFSLGLAVFFSCSDPALLGSDLLSEDQANLLFSDKIPIEAKTIQGTAVQTFSPFVSLQLSKHLFGNIDDPVFGKNTSSIYTQVSLGTQDSPSRDLPRFDSLVLSLAYDTVAGYGNIAEPLEVEVLQLGESMVNIEDYFSDHTFAITREPLGSATFLPDLSTPLLIREYTGDEPVDTMTDAHIRISLNEEFGDMLLQDTLLYLADTALQRVFKGMHIRPIATSSGLINIDFASDLTRISLYYSTGRNDTERKHEYRFDFNQGNARSVNIDHNYDNSVVKSFMKNNADSLLFIQGMTGVNTRISFPDVSDLQGVVVNKAELELTVASYDSVFPENVPAAAQIIAVTGEGENKDVIVDVRSALFAQEPIRTEIFGGIPGPEEQNGQVVTKYRINLSGHFQEIVNGTVDNSLDLTSGVEQTNFYFQITPKATDASRLIIFGPNHSEFPLKLNLTYTRL